MIILVLGGSGSGKSAFAEDISVFLSKKPLYIATMMPFGDEALARINRHIKMRKDKGFESVDCYRDLDKICDLKGYDAILLECMSNLLANELYSENKNEDIVNKIIGSVKKLNSQTKNLIIVSNDVSNDINNYNSETMDYIKKLCEINRKIANFADIVVEVVCFISIYHKGEKLC